MPTTPLRDFVLLAERALATGQFPEALRRCDQALLASPRWIELLCIKAEALIALGQIPQAIPLLDQVLASQPESVRAFMARGRAFQRQGDRMGELACYRRACELAPEDANLRALHNQLAAQLGRTPYAPTHTGLARVYLRSELFIHALREWDTALRANPDRLDAQVGIAETFWRMNNQARAVEICRAILQPMPFCLKPLLMVAESDLRQGRRAEALRQLRLAGEMDPELHIAGELFADLVTSGDDVLAQALRETSRSVLPPIMARLQMAGGDPSTGPNGSSRPGAPPSTPLTGPYARSSSPTGSQTNGSRPLAPTPGTNPHLPQANGNALDAARGQSATKPFGTGPLSIGMAPTGPLFPGNTPQHAPLAPTAKLPTTPAPNNATQPFNENAIQQLENAINPTREAPVPAAPVPEEFKKVIRETEHMLWHDERNEGQQSAIRRAPDPDVTPSEAEMDFVRWLQAQGAQPLAEAGTLPNAATSSVIAPPPFLVEALRQAAPVESAPPAPAVRNEADASPAPSQPPTIMALPPTFDPPVAPAPSAPMPPPDPDVAAPAIIWPTSPVTPRFVAPPAFPAESAGRPPAVPEPPPPSAPDEPPALTIEAIEEGLSAGGFARHETGRLATVASMLDEAPPEEVVPAMDVPARLEHARQLRHKGQRAESLGEFRLLVKANADELPLVVRALMDAAIEDPHEPEIYRLLGDAQIRLGNYVESLDAYNRASGMQREAP